MRKGFGKSLIRRRRQGVDGRINCICVMQQRTCGSSDSIFPGASEALVWSAKLGLHGRDAR